MMVVSSGQSYIGLARGDNQDEFYICEPEEDQERSGYGCLYAIADGMGGTLHGGIASSQAIKAFAEHFYTGRRGHPTQNLRRAIQAANLAVYQLGHVMGGSSSMGTTFSAVNLVNNRLYFAHVGDSRIYLIRDGLATCITRDHTPVGDLVAMHVISPDQVRTHENRSQLHRALGLQLFVQPDIDLVDLQPDDTIILCSDGIWSVIEDDEFARLAVDLENPAYLGEVLVDRALRRYSDDNLSVIAIRVQQLASVAQTHRNWRIARLFRNYFADQRTSTS
jgi:serine/threonine protein phosphatase PrpC